MLRAMASRGTPSLLLRPRVVRPNLRRAGASVHCVSGHGPEPCDGFFVVGGRRLGAPREIQIPRINSTKGLSTRRNSVCASSRAFVSRTHRHLIQVRASNGGGETAVGAADGGVTAAREAQTTRFHRFYVDELLPDAGGYVTLGKDESKHALKALRLRAGDSVEVCDGVGGGGEGKLVGVESGGRGDAVATIALTNVARTTFAGPKWSLVVACGGLKGGRADWLVEKAAELGAHKLIPLTTERSAIIGSASREPKKKAKKNNEETAGREGRWSRVASAASKQCLRAHTLEITQPISVQELITQIRESEKGVVLLCAAGAPALRVVLENGEKNIERGSMLLVGPEGDFTDLEIRELVDAGATPVGLGPLRLRVETAAVAAMACVGMMHPREQPPGC